MSESGHDPALVTRGLRKRYGSRQALDGLDLTVPSGTVYGFLGPNGAGKTTTMRLLTGLLHPDEGTIEIFGRRFARGDRRLLFEVGALIETPSFYPYLSARANLRELAATGAHTDAARIETVLELVDLRDRAAEPVGQFSLGMKQRLGIAAALLSDPRLLLLDEPSNGLDPAGIVAMREMLRNLTSVGKTVFVSSHLLAEVRHMADYVGIIASGRIVREGSIATLLEREGDVRVRVRPADVPRAAGILAGLATPELVRVSDPEAGWIDVHINTDRSEGLNAVLAQAGVFASQIEFGTDLEELFLRLTNGTGPGPSEGTVQRAPAITTSEARS
jgi:ABC-2 type transport system ATP-binding protein